MAGEDADRLLHCLRRRYSGDEKTPQQKRRSKLHYSSPMSASPSAAAGAAQKRMEIAPGVFYGSPLGKPSNCNPLRLLHELHRDRKNHEELITETPGSESVWETFARQEQAIEYGDRHKDVAIFTYQDHHTGQRRFLATSYEEFWKRYQRMQPHLRHHYEIIREKRPCHLYFDVEFSRKTNQGADGEAMVDLLLEIVSSTLADTFALSYCSSWTLELDSSTSEKFSRHLIIRIPKTAFKDNSHAGAFVAEVCVRIQTLRGSDARLDQLFVTDADPVKAKLFVDQAVYSRNRSFRLVFSAKAGKTAVLLPTYRFGLNVMDDSNTFMLSLICKLDDDCETLLTFDEKTPGHGGLRTSREPVSTLKPQSVGAGVSPFGELDAFIESVSSVGNIPGKVRNWYWFSELEMIVYNISGNRYCERIERQHKSNNVMYIVDLRRCAYYQKCHDPDCRGYKSALRPVPSHLVVPSHTVAPLLAQQQEGEDDSWWQEVAGVLDG